MQIKNWSYSRYSTWKKCPALLKYQMEDHTPRAQHPAAARGQVLHKVIEDYLNGNIRELPMELAYYTDFLDVLVAQEEDVFPEYPIALDVQWSPVEWDDENRWWRGVLDCVIRAPDEIIIVDWKTGQEYGDHKDQRDIYAAAYDSAHQDNLPIRAIHVYLDKKLNAVSNYRPSDLPDIRDKWEVSVEEMFNDKAFVPNPGFHCRFCPYSRWNNGPCKF